MVIDGRTCSTESERVVVMSQQEIREDFSRTKVKELREALKEIEPNPRWIRKLFAPTEIPAGCVVVVNGSFARLDASAHSDVDFFVLCQGEMSARAAKRVLKRVKGRVLSAIDKAQLQPPSDNGAFGAIESVSCMLRNVGGMNDPNDKLTRRMLLMLEGDWLTEPELFASIRQQLISEVYIRTLEEGKLARFFLNDVVRYWRTLGVDFAYKTVEDNKPWGIRILKLIFSRKLIYFSGILMASETAKLSNNEKIQRLVQLAAMTPVDRIRNVCGDKADLMLTNYERFLERMADGEFRDMAKATSDDRKTHCEQFKQMKKAGKEFSLQLDQLLRDTYPSDHAIHHALVY